MEESEHDDHDHSDHGSHGGAHEDEFFPLIYLMLLVGYVIVLAVDRVIMTRWQKSKNEKLERKRKRKELKQ